MPPASNALRLRRACLLAGASLGALGACPFVRAQGRAAGEVLIGGTGSGVSPMKHALAGLAGLRFVPNLGSGGGLKALAAGAIDIAVTARPLEDGERMRGLVAREWFRTPMVFACHASVPVQRVTQTELVALYAGRTAKWPDGTPVRLVLRPESDSDTRLQRAMSPAMTDALAAAHARPGAHITVTDLDSAESIERIQGALGLMALSTARSEARRVTVLELDGIKPGVDTLASGRYPHAKTVYLVTRSGVAAEVSAAVAAATAARAAPLLANVGCLTKVAA